MRWKHSGSTTPKQFRTQPSASKVAATDILGLQRDYFEIDRLQAAGVLITGEYYLIKKKRKTNEVGLLAELCFFFMIMSLYTSPELHRKLFMSARSRS